MKSGLSDSVGVSVCQLTGSVAVTGSVASLTKLTPTSTWATPELPVTVDDRTGPKARANGQAMSS